MDEEMMSTQELLEKREKETYLELGKLTPTDPNYGKILSAAKTYSEIRNTYDSAEQKRLDTYAKNEIEEHKLQVEEAKVKNDKRRTWVDFAKAGLFLMGGFFSGFSGYMLDTWFQKDTRMQRFSEKVHDAILRK